MQIEDPAPVDVLDEMAKWKTRMDYADACAVLLARRHTGATVLTTDPPTLPFTASPSSLPAAHSKPDICISSRSLQNSTTASATNYAHTYIMKHVAIDQVLERAERAKSDSDCTYFFALLFAAEAMAKTIVLGIVASITDEKDRNRYRLEHQLTRSYGLGD